MSLWVDVVSYGTSGSLDVVVQTSNDLENWEGAPMEYSGTLSSLILKPTMIPAVGDPPVPLNGHHVRVRYECTSGGPFLVNTVMKLGRA